MGPLKILPKHIPGVSNARAGKLALVICFYADELWGTQDHKCAYLHLAASESMQSPGTVSKKAEQVLQVSDEQ